LDLLRERQLKKGKISRSSATKTVILALRALKDNLPKFNKSLRDIFYKKILFSD
jgi:hypothetical protein